MQAGGAGVSHNACLHIDSLSFDKTLKSGKSFYLDDISNESLKSGYETLKRPLKHLFNIIYQKGSFPDMWRDGFIVPIHKKNDILDVNNYRGIIISSCIGKLFLKILTKRIDMSMRSTHKWSVNQCGFKPDHRTEDSLFILNTIFETHVTQQNKKIYLAFVDFSKFFDKINRTLLFYKLLKYGITGKAFRIIKCMYENTGYRVRVNDTLSPRFIAHQGMKQGCCLSPILSNIFQNDLHELFNSEDCRPVTLGNACLNSLSWADDLVLVSESPHGLQLCLNRLRSYCLKWGLEVNVDKTKTMIFSKGTVKLQQPFNFGNSSLENVTSTEYLGFHLKSNNDVSHIISNRVSKARRVTHIVMQAISTNHANISPQLALNLFDRQIEPILHYGAAIWSVPRTNNLVYLHNQCGNNSRDIVFNLFQQVLGQRIPFVYARKIGRKPTGNIDNRTILLEVCSYTHKEMLLRDHPVLFSDYTDKGVSKTEGLHNYYCKRTLNVTKYSSTKAVYTELGRGPILNKAWGMAIKYWIRLENGTANTFLNEAYTEAKRNEHSWLQSIQYLLCKNGFRDMWLDKASYDHRVFHNYFLQRLDDQFKQNLSCDIASSSRFRILSSLKDNFGMSPYLTHIRNPNIRNIFTRLRIDLNCLATCKTQGNFSMCPMCKLKPETVEHFIIKCPHYTDERNLFTAKILPISQHYSSYDNVRKIQYILDLRCPTQAVSPCIKFISTIYKTREKSSWCTSAWMLISIITVCPPFSFEITIHKRGYMDFVCLHEAGNIYVYILDLRCFCLAWISLTEQRSSWFLPI